MERSNLELAAALLTGLLTACGRGAVQASAAPWSIDLLVPRRVVDPEQLFHEDPLCRFDEVGGLLLVPDADATWPWPEAPGGVLHVRTNNLGFLELEATRPEKEGLRILAVGDSHLVIVDAADSFPNVLEAKLRAAGHAGCEVINAGVGYTGPPWYLKRVEKYLELEPDVVLVAIFAGNDFWDTVLTRYDVGASPTPPLGEAYWERLRRCREQFPGALSQGLNQAHWFKHWPGSADLALREVLASMEAIQALCRAHDLPLWTVIIPTKSDVDIEDEPELRQRSLDLLELSEEEAAANLRLSERLAAALVERGIPCLDPTQAMRADPTRFYWRQDHHLAVNGHRFLAERLFETMEPSLP